MILGSVPYWHLTAHWSHSDAGAGGTGGTGGGGCWCWAAGWVGAFGGILVESSCSLCVNMHN